MEDFEKPVICPFCGGVKPTLKNQKNLACECTCTQCSDGKDMD